MQFYLGLSANNDFPGLTVRDRRLREIYPKHILTFLILTFVVRMVAPIDMDLSYLDILSDKLSTLINVLNG